MSHKKDAMHTWVNVLGLVLRLNNMKPDQVPCYVGPELGTKCLPSITADDISRQKFNNWMMECPILLIPYKRYPLTLCLLRLSTESPLCMHLIVC